MIEGIIIGIFIVILMLGLALPDYPTSKCKEKDCNLGPGWHIHFPEGRTYMTPKQRQAMRRSIQRAREYHERKHNE